MTPLDVLLLSYIKGCFVYCPFLLVQFNFLHGGYAYLKSSMGMSHCPSKHMTARQTYSKIVRASEDAIRTLIKAQQECEEKHLVAAEPDPGEN